MSSISIADEDKKQISSHVREVLQQAADIIGITLDKFMMLASYEQAQQIIENETIIT